MTQVDLLPEGQTLLLDRYQLIGTISSGGMGTVSLARIAGVAGFQRFVAIKQLHPHLAREREFVEMFLDEARLAAGIHHQNVVSILEIGTCESGYYLAMEYIEGASLARLLARSHELGKPPDRAIVFRILLDALAGLHAAHELTDEAGDLLGLVHRDCSPQNILLGIDGSTKITDFGVARAASRLATTREGSFKGKLAYMAPEQTQGETIDRRADLFAIGTLLWEMLARRRLFRAQTDAQTLNRLLHEPIPRLADVAPDIHPALDALCAKALQREPDKRFQTAEEMAEALEQVARAAARPDDEYSIALVRSVAGFVTGVLGENIESQRESVRSWLSRREKTPAPPGAVPSAQRPIDLLPHEPSGGAGARIRGEATQGEIAPPGALRGRSGQRPLGETPADESTLPRTVRSLDEEPPRRLLAPWSVGAALAVVVGAVAAWLALAGGQRLEDAPPAAGAPRFETSQPSGAAAGGQRSSVERPEESAEVDEAVGDEGAGGAGGAAAADAPVGSPSSERSSSPSRPASVPHPRAGARSAAVATTRPSAASSAPEPASNPYR